MPAEARAGEPCYAHRSAEDYEREEATLEVQGGTFRFALPADVAPQTLAENEQKKRVKHDAADDPHAERRIEACHPGTRAAVRVCGGG